MKNKFSLLTVFISALAISACSAKLSTDNNDKVDQESTNWPKFSDQTVAGSVAGAEWRAVTAVAKKSGLANSISISLYGEVIPSACSPYTISSKPYATIVIPANYATTEYRTDYVDSLTGSSPINFIAKDAVGTITNSLAERTRFSITSIDATAASKLMFGLKQLTLTRL